MNLTQIRHGYQLSAQYSTTYYLYVVFHECLCSFAFPSIQTFIICYPKRYHVFVTLYVLVDRLLLAYVLQNGFVSIKERESSAYRFRLQTVSTIDGSLPFRTCCAHFVLYRTTVQSSILTLPNKNKNIVSVYNL